MISLSMMTGESGVAKSSRRLRRHRQKLLMDTDYDHRHLRARPTSDSELRRTQLSLLCVEHNHFPQNIDFVVQENKWEKELSLEQLLTCYYCKEPNLIIDSEKNFPSEPSFLEITCCCNCYDHCAERELNSCKFPCVCGEVRGTFRDCCASASGHLSRLHRHWKTRGTEDIKSRYDGDDNDEFGMTEWQVPRT